MEEGKYIYSIIKEKGDRNFGSIGINSREVNLILQRDIAAVVSNTPVINFDRLDKKELTSYVAVHQRVNEEVMKEYDVVPMTFGVIAPNIAEVSRILERAYLQFKTALKKIEGRAEFVVQVWWDQKKLLEELANRDPEIKQLREEISLKRGILGIPIKLKLGRLIHQKAEVQRENYIKNIQAFLKGSAGGSASNKLIGDEMIANFSFLIDRAREPELDRKMQELGKRYGGRLRFKYIGPMPPYCFVNINLSLGNFELVDEARKLLGLAEVATFDEIKKAYYTLANQYHPDKHPDNSERVEEQMKNITQAYSVLENYCQSCDECGMKKGDQRYSFQEEDVRNSIMIK